MKKLFSVALSLMLALSILVIPVSAASPAPAVTVEYSNEKLEVSAQVPRLLRADPLYDLNVVGKVSMSFKTLYPTQTVYSNANFRTNSQKIVLKLTGDATSFVRVSLYDEGLAAGIAQKTVTVNKYTTTITFSNLVAGKNYFLKFENFGQTAVNLKGIITQ